jgi:hypothetical protein
MTDKDKELLIKEKTQEVLDENDYIFENREDFVKSRTNWDRLADIAEDFYDAQLIIFILGISFDYLIKFVRHNLFPYTKLAEK